MKSPTKSPKTTKNTAHSSHRDGPDFQSDALGTYYETLHRRGGAMLDKLGRRMTQILGGSQ